MVRLGCIFDDCDAQPVELHLSGELEGDYETLSKISVQCSCGAPLIPQDEKEQIAENVIALSWARFADDYLNEDGDFPEPF